MFKENYQKFFMLCILIVLLFSITSVYSQDITEDNDMVSDELSVDNSNIKTSAIETSKHIKQDYTESAKNISSEKNQDIEKDDIESDSADNNYITEDIDHDCSSSIVQKNENETAISFRLDSGSTLDLYINNNTVIKQYKTRATYFFHCMISPTGWVVGNGGSDSGEQNTKIEQIAIKMIENNCIDSASIDEIYKIKKYINRGHFIIKAPNGTYAVIQCFLGKYKKEMGVLKSGEYIVCPNDPKYYHKGNYISYTGTTNISDATRLLAAHDRYGTLRSQITTFEYIKKNHETNISVYLANDDGRYVGVNSKRYCNYFNISGIMVKPSQIPVINNKLHVITYKYKDTNIKTSTTTKDINTTHETICLKANVVDDTLQKVNEGKVIFKINGETIKNAKGNPIYVNVVNGSAEYVYNLRYLWKNNFTYTAKYVGTKTFKSSESKPAVITTNIVRLYTLTKPILSEDKIEIVTYVNFTHNLTKVDEGYLLYKINGITLKNKNNKIILSEVKNGISTIIIDNDYSPKKYNLSVCYINKKYKKNTLTYFTPKVKHSKAEIKPITTKSYTAKLTGKITNIKGINIKGTVKFCIKINGVTIKDSKNRVILFKAENGIINVTFNIPKSLKTKFYDLTIKTQDRSDYLSTNANTTLTIK